MKIKTALDSSGRASSKKKSAQSGRGNPAMIKKAELIK